MKALKNFDCNGVDLKAGDEISSENLAKIGDQLDGLVSAGLVDAPLKASYIAKAEEAPFVDNISDDLPKPSKKKK